MGTEQFRTDRLPESAIPAGMAVLVICRQRSLGYHRQAGILTLATRLVMLATLLLPLAPFAAPLGFQPLPLRSVVALLGIVRACVAGAELAKRWL